MKNNMSIGDLQGSIIRPTLSNILYDDVLNIRFEDEETRTVAYSGDIVLYVKTNSPQN